MEMNNMTLFSIINGIENKLESHIPVIHAIKFFIPVALNIIHPTTANANVTNICPASFNDGNHFAFVLPSGSVIVATISR